MKLLVLGATGATGCEVVTQALWQGHDVTALVRHPEKLGRIDGTIRVVTGDVLDGSRILDAAMFGQDAVISALGVGKSLNSGHLIARSVPLIVGAMIREGVSRLIFVSAYGVGKTRENVPLVPRILMRLLLRDIYADKEAGENHIHGSGLNWTIAYPVTLTNGPRTEQYRASERPLLRGLPRVSRADVAHFLLRQLSNDEFRQRGVIVSS